MCDKAECAREYYVERRQRLKGQGLCLMCGKAEAFYGHKYCADCLYKTQMRNIQYRYGDGPEADWYKEWRVKHAECHRTRYAQRKAAGICTRCGKREAWEGHTRCKRCAYLDRASANKLYRQKHLDDTTEPKAERKPIAPKPRPQAADHPWRRDNRAIFGDRGRKET